MPKATLRSTTPERLRQCRAVSNQSEAAAEKAILLAQVISSAVSDVIAKERKRGVLPSSGFIDASTLASTLVRVREQVDRRYTAPSSMPDRLSRWLKSLIGGRK